MFIVYRKQDGVVVESQMNSYITEENINKDTIVENIVERFGGNVSDYSIMVVSEVEENTELLNKLTTHYFTISDGAFMFGNKIPIPEPEPQPPSSEERIDSLEQEKMMLQIALAESIEKQETDKVNSQIALAELVETLIIRGVL